MTLRRSPRLPPEQLASYLLELPTPADPADPVPRLDWAAAFGNDHPVELEVGFGKGLFLLTEAEARPGVNFAGVEIERAYALYTATRAAKRALPNLRVACADARVFLRDRVETGSLRAVHVYFPDPWWKKRHHKRRVFTDDFVGECRRVLRPGGMLHVATDVADYFEVIAALLGDTAGLKELPPPAEKAPEHDLDYLTNFERKKRKAGKPIYRAVRERLPPES